jgi:Ca-activated chloride channel family protein
VYPTQLPDLFAGEELVILGRYDGRANIRAPITITGQRAGRTETFTMVAELPAHEGNNDFMPKLWAARKVGELAQQLKLEGQNRALLDELRETALRYGIVSEYTSYLVLEEDAQLPRDRIAVGRAAGNVRAQAGAVPPAAPQVSGQSAVMKAESMRRAREAKSTADIAHAEAAMNQAAGAASDRRMIGGRTFEERNGQWTDVLARPAAETITVEPFSSAYFAMLRALPELEPIWRALPTSVTHGKRVSIEVKQGGKKQLSAQELQSVVARFRS